MSGFKTQKEAEDYVKNEYAKHKEEWLTQDIAEMYQQKGRILDNNCRLDNGERRKLRIELQQKYGLTEIEAVNILNGIHTLEIVKRYERMLNMTPIKVKEMLSERDE